MGRFFGWKARRKEVFVAGIRLQTGQRMQLSFEKKRIIFLKALKNKEKY